jgi:UDPglucose 6-dehydrogenase
MREAPSRQVIAALAARGARVVAYDPVAMDEAKRALGAVPHVAYAASPMAAVEGADALVVVTEWKEFRSPDFDAIRAKLKSPLLFDGRNLYDPEQVRAAGLEYFAIGPPLSRRRNAADGATPASPTAARAWPLACWSSAT